MNQVVQDILKSETSVIKNMDNITNLKYRTGLHLLGRFVGEDFFDLPRTPKDLRERYNMNGYSFAIPYRDHASLYDTGKEIDLLIIYHMENKSSYCPVRISYEELEEGNFRLRVYFQSERGNRVVILAERTNINYKVFSEFKELSSLKLSDLIRGITSQELIENRGMGMKDEMRKSSVILSAPELVSYEVYIIGPEDGEEYISPSFPKEIDEDKFTVLRCNRVDGKDFLIGTTKGFTTREHYLLNILEDKLGVVSSTMLSKDKELFLNMLHATGYIPYMDISFLREKNEKPVDLSKTDIYTDYKIPSKDLEITLKVIRTIRDAFTGGPQGYDTEIMVLLSHTHEKITATVKQLQETE